MCSLINMVGWLIEEELFEYYEGFWDGLGKECINVLIILGWLKIISFILKLIKKFKEKCYWKIKDSFYFFWMIIIFFWLILFDVKEILKICLVLEILV